MRNLGDLRWINDYIGIPYVNAGRDFTGADCYGIVKMVYQDVYGITLPDWVTEAMDFKEHNRIIDSVVTSGTFTEVEAPVDGTIVVCYRSRLSHHVGVFFGGGVLHTEKDMGCVYEPLSRFQKKFTKIIFGEWRP